MGDNLLGERSVGYERETFRLANFERSRIEFQLLCKITSNFVDNYSIDEFLTQFDVSIRITKAIELGQRFISSIEYYNEHSTFFCILCFRQYLCKIKFLLLSAICEY